MDGPPSEQPPGGTLAMCQTITLHLLQAPAGPHLEPFQSGEA